MIKDTKQRIMLTLPKDVIEAMDTVVKAFNKKGVQVTKSTLILTIFVQWLEYQNDEIELAQQTKGGKKNA